MILRQAAIYLRLALRALSWCLIVGLQLGVPGLATAQEETEAEQRFVEQTLPILREHCFECHSHEAGEGSGQLMLDSLTAMQTGGTRGAAVVAGDTDQSLLMQAVRYDNPELQMPPDGKLSAAAIAILKQWIADGARVPANFRGRTPDAPNRETDSQAATHWAYQLPVEVDLDPQLGEHPIDALLRSQLTEAGLQYSPRADRRTLIKRAYYDLIGLPPDRHQIADFLNDPRGDREAFSAVVDALLNSPHFGERWARYWMDVARYADNKGYVFQEDREYPEAYKYRDWLISAFNNDMPYDEFVTQQLAADLLAPAAETQVAEADAPPQADAATEPAVNPNAADAAPKAESPVAAAQPGNLPALGFLTLGRRFLNNKLDIIDDRLDVVSRGLMGMTLTCARCHDHKYDPVTQADYYALAGVFLNTEEPGGEPWPHRLQDATTNRQAYILIRGSPGRRGDPVSRRFVRFLAPDERPLTEQGSGRLQLAQHIVSPNNPLTARVMANRIWLRLTGQSLVESPSDFGLRCPPPKQLPLLDHLALELIDQGWSMKSLIRHIMLSDAYAQTSLERPSAAAVDPANELFWRMNRRRLDFEALRDTLLARTGNLDYSLYGKSQRIDTPPYSPRRTVYAYIDRQNLPSLFRTFDLASPDSHNPQRAETTVPQQGLFLLNSGFVAKQAEDLAARLERIAAARNQQAAIVELFQSVLGRQPREVETVWFQEFLKEQRFAPELPPSRSHWEAGYASYDAGTQTIRNFQPLPHRSDRGWQGGPELPDATLGWCLLTDRGGHPGNDLEHAVVRRWIAPRAGVISIAGKLNHRAEEGDGVRGSILADNSLVRQWTVHHGTQRTGVQKLSVEPGQTVDFVTDCLGSPNHDSFEWTVVVRYADGPEKYASEKGLPEPAPEPLSVWAQAVQALLLSNELTFVD